MRGLFPFCAGDVVSEQLSGEWLQLEQISLEDLYAPCDAKGVHTLSALDPEIRQRGKDLGVFSLPSTQMDEEQAREVNHERERERELEISPEAEPVEHILHPGVLDFVKKGVLPPLHTDSAFHYARKEHGRNSRRGRLEPIHFGDGRLFQNDLA
ncbi:hypothetical protein JVU11DRAFT_9042 [Chiua virens]|nr:hypothetical protein JVU11DRAFT_11666 [Chiua virens]KAG9311130.1 hypothetical protein JVU11DRAFT_9042 [Chiua virens]